MNEDERMFQSRDLALTAATKPSLQPGAMAIALAIIYFADVLKTKRIG